MTRTIPVCGLCVSLPFIWGGGKLGGVFSCQGTLGLAEARGVSAGSSGTIQCWGESILAGGGA
jgi:hypothetical protein